MKDSLIIIILIACIGSCVIGATFPPLGVFIIFLVILLGMRSR